MNFRESRGSLPLLAIAHRRDDAQDVAHTAFRHGARVLLYRPRWQA
jgi:hypothetical protein